MSWWSYVQQHAGDDTQAVVAQRAGVTAPTVSRWSTGKQGVDPRAAAAFARAYGRPVLEAFVAAEFLTAEEAKARPSKAVDFSQLTNDELLRLVRSRMSEENDRGDTAPTKQAGRAGASVTELKAPTREELDDGRAAAHKTRGVDGPKRQS